MVERAAVFDPKGRKHSAVEPPERDAEVVSEFRLRCGFALGGFDA